MVGGASVCDPRFVTWSSFTDREVSVDLVDGSSVRGALLLVDPVTANLLISLPTNSGPGKTTVMLIVAHSIVRAALLERWASDPPLASNEN